MSKEDARWDFTGSAARLVSILFSRHSHVGRGGQAEGGEEVMNMTRSGIWKAMEHRQELEACLGVSTPERIRRRAALLEYAHAAMHKLCAAIANPITVVNKRPDGGPVTILHDGRQHVIPCGESITLWPVPGERGE